MTIFLKPITQKNYQECIELQVSANQKNYVAANLFPLVQAAYEPETYPLAIYNETKMVGFLLYDFDTEINGWYLSRLMIDQEFQHQGYGKKALKIFLKDFFATHDANELYTSVEVDNPVAKKLYLELGFLEKDYFSYQIKEQVFHEQRLLLKRDRL